MEATLDGPTQTLSDGAFERIQAAIVKGEIAPGTRISEQYLSTTFGIGRGPLREATVHHSANGTFAIRQGKWKLVLCNGSGGREAPRGTPFKKPYFLFDLTEDISERQNVIEDHPEIARRLEKKCLELRDSDY